MSSRKPTDGSYRLLAKTTTVSSSAVKGTKLVGQTDSRIDRSLIRFVADGMTLYVTQPFASIIYAIGCMQACVRVVGVETTFIKVVFFL